MVPSPWQVTPVLAQDNPIAGPWLKLTSRPGPPPGARIGHRCGGGTDALMLPGQCKALARHVPVGLGEPGRRDVTSPVTSSSPSLLPRCRDSRAAIPAGIPKLSSMSIVRGDGWTSFYTAVVHATCWRILSSGYVSHYGEAKSDIRRLTRALRSAITNEVVAQRKTRPALREHLTVAVSPFTPTGRVSLCIKRSPPAVNRAAGHATPVVPAVVR